jgi:hypothetical protein
MPLYTVSEGEQPVRMSLGGTVLAVSWTEFGVVTLLFVARTYVNARILKQFNPDYWVASLTYVRLFLPVPCLSSSDKEP